MTTDSPAMAPDLTGDVDAVLARWRGDEERVRASSSGYGVVSAADLTAESGLVFLQDMVAGRHPIPPIGETLGFLLVGVEQGRAVFQGAPDPAYRNPMGVVHGGWFSTLLDSCMGCAVHSTLPAGKGYTTLELSVNMVRGISAETPLVRAEGWVVHRGGQVATAEGRLVGPDGRLYAHGKTTCLIFDARA